MEKATPAHTVLAFGEVLWDLLPTGKLLGGAPANFACRLHDLAVPIKLVSALGKDALGIEAKAILIARGVDTGLLQQNSYPTGAVSVTFNEQKKEPSYTIHGNAAYDYILPEPSLLEAAATAKLLYFGTLIQRSPRSETTLAAVLEAGKGAAKFLDVNLRRDCFNKESLKNSCRHADIVKLNSDEVEVIAGLLTQRPTGIANFCRAALSDFDLTAIVVTLGAQGAFAMHRNGEEAYVPGYRVAMVDSIGAGDAFSAGFVRQYLNAERLEECCSLGNILGALACTKQGGMGRIKADEITAFKEAGHARLSATMLCEQ